jgi:hypothetical protein
MQIISVVMAQGQLEFGKWRSRWRGPPSIWDLRSATVADRSSKIGGWGLKVGDVASWPDECFRRWCMSSNRKLVDGFRARSFVDWLFAVVSFLLFLALEGALLYAYFTFVNHL